jgi:hypothetical protein
MQELFKDIPGYNNMKALFYLSYSHFVALKIPLERMEVFIMVPMLVVKCSIASSRHANSTLFIRVMLTSSRHANNSIFLFIMMYMYV